MIGVGVVPKIETKTTWLPSSRKSTAPVDVIITLAADEANTLSIFGVTDRFYGRDVVDDVVAPKRVDGIVFNFSTLRREKKLK